MTAGRCENFKRALRDVGRETIDLTRISQRVDRRVFLMTTIRIFRGQLDMSFLSS